MYSSTDRNSNPCTISCKCKLDICFENDLNLTIIYTCKNLPAE